MSQNTIRMHLSYLKEIETEELDLVLKDKIFGEYWENSEQESDIVVYDNKSSWLGMGTPMLIDDMLKILKSLKKEGCNFIEIMHHVDHHSYVFNGVIIRKSTEEENKKEIEKEKILKKLKKQHQAKLSELKVIEEKYNQIK